MASANKNNYFQMMKEMAQCALEAAEMLDGTLHAFSLDTLDENVRALHALEHRGDTLKHRLVEKLTKEFITPIEREDIMTIASQIDDVTDAVEDVLLKISMYNLQEIPETALAFSGVVTQCVKALVAAFSELENYKKSKTIHNALVEINRLEEQGDALYFQGVKALYVSKADPLLAIGMTEVYACLELCCDMCENTADLVEQVVMKNT